MKKKSKHQVHKILTAKILSTRSLEVDPVLFLKFLSYSYVHYLGKSSKLK